MDPLPAPASPGCGQTGSFNRGQPMPALLRRNWLRYIYDAEFHLDAAGPTWAATVLREIRLPRWTYEGHDHGAAVFTRVPQKLPDGLTEVRLRLLPEKPLPHVSMEIDIEGRWKDGDESHPPPPAVGDIHEEAEALLVLLGCRSPRFHFVRTLRVQ